MGNKTIKQVNVKINIDNSESRKKAKETKEDLKGIGGAAKKASTSFKSGFLDMGKAAAALGGAFLGLQVITRGLVDTTKVAIDAEETHSKLLAVFSNQTEEVGRVIKDLADNYILSTSGAEKMVAATGDILTGFGFTQKAALDLSHKVAVLGADLASFTNIEGGAENAVKALSAAMVGETERAKALGIVIRQDSVQFKNLVKEGMALRGETLLQAKAMAVLTIATEQSKNSIGDVAKTANSTANVIKRFGADIVNLQSSVGKFTAVILKNFILGINFLTDNMLELGTAVLIVGGYLAKGLIVAKVAAAWAALGTAIAGVIPLLTTVGGILSLSFGALVIAAGAAIIAISKMVGVIGDLISESKELDKSIARQNATLEEWTDNVSQFAKELSELKLTLPEQAEANAAMMAIQSGLTAISIAGGSANDKLIATNKLMRSIRDGKYGEVAAKHWKTFTKAQISGFKTTKELEAFTAKQAKAALLKKKLEDEAKATKLAEKELKEYKKTAEKLTNSLGILTTKGFKKLNTETKITTNLFQKNKKQILSNKDSMEIFEDKVKSLVKTYQIAGKDVPKSLLKIEKSIFDAKNTNLDWLPVLKNTSKAIKEYAPTVEMAADKTKPFQKELDKINETAKETSTTFENVQAAVFGLVDVLGGLGIVSEDTAQTMGSFANAGMQLFDAFKSGKLSDKINAVANAVVTLGSKIIEWLTGDGVGEAIKRENEWMDVTEEQEEALRKLEKQIGSTHAATSTYLDTLLDGVVTLENSDKWLNRIRGTLSDVDQGMLSSSEAAKEIGDAFASWIDQLGGLAVGTKAYRDFVQDLKNRGIEVAEVTDFINESWDNAIDAWRAFKTETGSTIELPVLDELIAKQDELAKDKYQPALKGLDALNQTMINLGNTARKITDEEFNSLEAGAREMFDTLTRNGLDFETALNSMQPVLSNLINLQKNHGLEIDDSTQALIDQAKGYGINLDVQKSVAEQGLELQRQELNLFKEIARALGVNVDAMEGFGNAAVDAFGKAAKSAKGFGKNLSGISVPKIGDIGRGGGKGIPQFKNGADFMVPGNVGPQGMPIIVDKNEHVKVTPEGQSGSNGGIRDINVSIFPERGDSETEIMNKFVRGYRNNVSNVQGEING